MKSGGLRVELLRVGFYMVFICYTLESKQPNLKLKTWLKLLVGYLPLRHALMLDVVNFFASVNYECS